MKTKFGIYNFSNLELNEELILKDNTHLLVAGQTALKVVTIVMIYRTFQATTYATPAAVSGDTVSTRQVLPA